MASSRRSCLSVPGSSPRMLAKAAGLSADEVVIDLEDSVVPERKGEARALVAETLRSWKGPAVAVRINPLASSWGRDDVAALARLQDAVGSLVVPKVESRAELEEVERLLGRGPGGPGLQALIETAAGLLRVGELAGASERLEALITGYADLAASLGRPPRSEYPGDRWHHVRETVLVAARAAGLQAIDGPHLEVADLEGLRVEAGRARALGFDGKWALHPAQVEPLNAAFSPTVDELDHARAVLEALEQAGDRGAALLDGEMIDEASRKLATQVLARGRAAGLP
jgi:citrate lyase subunit beta / citryl-CoA lyase